MRRISIVAGMKQRRFASLSLVIVALVVATFGVIANVGAEPSRGTLTTTLIGAEEVPGPGDPDGSGFAVLRLDVDENTICYQLIVRDIQLPATGAHIHVGSANDFGPVVQGLTPPTAAGSSSVGTSSGCVQPTNSTLVQDILQNPEDYYVNVHNTPYPAGAVRGQLGD